MQWLEVQHEESAEYVKLEPQDSRLVGQAQKYMIMFQIFRLHAKSLCYQADLYPSETQKTQGFPLLQHQ